MKHLAFVVWGTFLVTSSAWAQDTDATAPAETPSAEAPADSPPEEKKSPYSKKVKGWLWLEAVAGPSSYDPDRFGALSLGTTTGGAPKLRGPQWGFSLGTGFGGGFFLGWYYRHANYDAYKLLRTGVEFQPTIRIPYVHIMFRVNIGLARMFDGNAWGLTDANNGGLDTTFGVGLRIPLVRWMSFAASLDWSYIGLSMRGNDPTSGDQIKQWISGRQLAGTFALTFHFIGVRND